MKYSVCNKCLFSRTPAHLINIWYVNRGHLPPTKTNRTPNPENYLSYAHNLLIKDVVWIFYETHESNTTSKHKWQNKVSFLTYSYWKNNIIFFYFFYETFSRLLVIHAIHHILPDVIAFLLSFVEIDLIFICMSFYRLFSWRILYLYEYFFVKFSLE